MVFILIILVADTLIVFEFHCLVACLALIDAKRQARLAVNMAPVAFIRSKVHEPSELETHAFQSGRVEEIAREPTSVAVIKGY